MITTMSNSIQTGEVLLLESDEFMATALELTRKGWQHFVGNAKHRSRSVQQSPEDKTERERLLALVRDAARILKARYGVQRVILIGSLAMEEAFSYQSDVDLAVEGLGVDDFFEAWRLIEEIIHDRPVDLIDMESAGDSMRQMIGRYGIEI
jgi:uncharacterized protein